MKNADFSYSLLNEANFEGADLRGAVFLNAEACAGVESASRWETVGYYGVNFKGANLENADFTGARLEGAIFDGAHLRGAVFSREQLGYLPLSSEQLRFIKVVE